MQGADSPNRLAPGHPGHSPSSAGSRRNRAQLLYKTSLALRSVLPCLGGPQFALGIAARMSARRSAQLPAAPSRAPTCRPRVPQAAGCALPCSTSLAPWLPRTPESQGWARRFLLLCAPPRPGDRTWGALTAPWHGDCWCRASTVSAERSSHSRCLCEGFSPGPGPRLIPPQMGPPADCRHAFNLHSSQAV